MSRIDLLRSLVRDDAEIKEEIEGRILRGDLLLDPATFRVEVENGVVTVEGQLDVDLLPKLLDHVSGTTA
ncbi:BON domain-containing protein [Streptomyces sp. NPDC001410]|uniref:BON domain-containing protein n=1 Tax=Streptomyces sp. NPDC001410 TaxID=3364574 RepID=UPI0036B3A4C8